jgi:hypothetical protein
MYKPGDKVVIERTITFRYEMEINDYMDGWDGFPEKEISDEDLTEDIRDNQGIEDVMAETDVEIIEDEPVITRKM